MLGFRTVKDMRARVLKAVRAMRARVTEEIWRGQRGR